MMGTDVYGLADEQELDEDIIHSSCLPSLLMDFSYGRCSKEARRGEASFIF